MCVCISAHPFLGACLFFFVLFFADGGDGFDVYEQWEGTDVHFADHTTEVLKAYIETGEPM